MPRMKVVYTPRHLAHDVSHETYLGLPVPALIAFAIGLICFVAAIAVGVIYSVQNFADFQAVQYFRMQWLLAAVAAFAAGILLRRPDASSSK